MQLYITPPPPSIPGKRKQGGGLSIFPYLSSPSESSLVLPSLASSCQVLSAFLHSSITSINCITDVRVTHEVFSYNVMRLYYVAGFIIPYSHFLKNKKLVLSIVSDLDPDWI